MYFKKWVKSIQTAGYNGARTVFTVQLLYYVCMLVTARLSGILKAKQKLGRTFNSHKLGGIDFTKILKTDHVQCLGGSPGHCTSQHRPAPALHMLSFENFAKPLQILYQISKLFLNLA